MYIKKFLASEAVLSTRSGWLRLRTLADASKQSREKALQWKTLLIPKKLSTSASRRPQTTVTVARRMIANSLNMRIDVSKEQLSKESTQLKLAKGNLLFYI